MVLENDMPNKIAALNWRWRFQFGHRGFQFGSVAFVCSLPAPVSELHRSGHTRMKTSALAIIFALHCSVWAQPLEAATNQITDHGVRYMSSSSNVMSISNAVKIASGLRVGMTKAEIDNYMHDHGMQTNVIGMSVDRGRTRDWFYPLGTAGSSLVIETECSQAPTSGLYGWKNPILKRAFIQSQGANIISVTLTNGP